MSACKYWGYCGTGGDAAATHRRYWGYLGTCGDAAVATADTGGTAVPAAGTGGSVVIGLLVKSPHPQKHK